MCVLGVFGQGRDGGHGSEIETVPQSVGGESSHPASNRKCP